MKSLLELPERATLLEWRELTAAGHLMAREKQRLFRVCLALPTKFITQSVFHKVGVIPLLQDLPRDHLCG